MKTKIRESFDYRGFRVVPVLVWNMYQRSFFNRYIIYLGFENLGYVNDYTKLSENTYKDIEDGYIELKDYSNLSMLKY